VIARRPGARHAGVSPDLPTAKTYHKPVIRSLCGGRKSRDGLNALSSMVLDTGKEIAEIARNTLNDTTT
jgi:hypothetical protein